MVANQAPMSPTSTTQRSHEKSMEDIYEEHLFTNILPDPLTEPFAIIAACTNSL
jgi:hypothetical protein